MNEPVERIVSLGSQCLTSTLLKRMELKTESYPFDWIFSSPAMVAHCIEDDFAIFADRSRYVPGHGGNGPHCYHGFYNTFLGLDFPIFNYHDPSTDEGHEYLTRCVNRFRAALLLPSSLFILIRQAGHSDEVEFEMLAAAMHRRAAHAAMRYMVYIQSPERAGTAEIARADNRCVLINISTRTLPTAEARFLDPVDDEPFIADIRSAAERLAPTALLS